GARSAKREVRSASVAAWLAEAPTVQTSPFSLLASCSLRDPLQRNDSFQIFPVHHLDLEELLQKPGGAHADHVGPGGHFDDREGTGRIRHSPQDRPDQLHERTLNRDADRIHHHPAAETGGARWGRW